MHAFKMGFHYVRSSLTVMPFVVMAAVEIKDSMEAMSWEPSWVPPEKLNTGDLVLFARPWYKYPFTAAAQICVGKALMRSPWDHVGIVVVTGGVPHVLESDFNGIHMLPYEDRVRTSRAKAIGVRLLKTDRDAAMVARLTDYVQSLRADSYHNYTDLFRSTLESKSEMEYYDLLVERSVLEAHVRDIQSRKGLHGNEAQRSRMRLLSVNEDMERKRGVVEGLWRDGETKRAAKRTEMTAPFSSELVATAYQVMGVLPSPHPPAWKYLPVDFLTELPLARGCELSEVVVVRTGPKPKELTD
eukprot:PhM_4_TR16599/c0_g1_i1/m.2595